MSRALSVLCLFVLLAGCAMTERDPPAVHWGAPGAYEVPVTTFAVVPF